MMIPVASYGGGDEHLPGKEKPQVTFWGKMGVPELESTVGYTIALIRVCPKSSNCALEKTLMLGRIKGRRRRGQQRLRSLGGIINSMHMSLSKHWGMVKVREAWCDAVHGVARVGHDLRD